MPYQILDDGASIRFVSGTGEQLIMKKDIREASVVREDLIEIKTGPPLQSIFFRHRDVTSPATVSAPVLREAINAMITNCICCGGGGPIPGR